MGHSVKANKGCNPGSEDTPWTSMIHLGTMADQIQGGGSSTASAICLLTGQGMKISREQVETTFGMGMVSYITQNPQRKECN